MLSLCTSALHLSFSRSNISDFSTSNKFFCRSIFLVPPLLYHKGTIGGWNDEELSASESGTSRFFIMLTGFIKTSRAGLERSIMG